MRPNHSNSLRLESAPVHAAFDHIAQAATQRFDDDALIAALRADPELASRGLRRWLAAALDDEVRKAHWTYRKVASRLGWPKRPTFESEYIENSADYYRCAASVSATAASLPMAPRELWLAWHHPAAPRLMAGVADAGVLTLIAQRADWMLALMGERNTLSFRAPGSGIRLLRAFREGRAVACMIDFCYPESACAEGPFLGFRVRTPIGVLALASRFGYRLTLIGYRGGTPTIAARVDATGRLVDELVDWANHGLQQQIAADPAAWLLWPTLDRRACDLDYD